MATYTKRGKRWLVAVRLKGVNKAQTFPTRGEGEAWARDVEHRIRAGKSMSVGNRIVRDAIDRYAEDVSIHKPSHANELKRLTFLAKQPFAALRMDTVDTPHLAAFRDDRLRTVSGSSVCREFNLLSHVFNVAQHEWKWIGHNPCKGVRRPKSNKARTRRVSERELETLYVAAGSDIASVSHRVVLAFEFCIETAMRGGEALRLVPATIGRDRVHLPQTKNGDARDVPLSRRAKAILKLLPDGFGITDRQKDALFRKVRDKAGLPDLTFHDSRHEGISRLASIFDVLELARIVGHRNVNELLTYYHADVDALALKLQRAQRTSPSRRKPGTSGAPPRSRRTPAASESPPGA